MATPRSKFSRIATVQTNTDSEDAGSHDLLLQGDLMQGLRSELIAEEFHIAAKSSANPVPALCVVKIPIVELSVSGLIHVAVGFHVHSNVSQKTLKISLVALIPGDEINLEVATPVNYVVGLRSSHQGAIAFVDVSGTT